jgi:hypothetical protein
VRITRRDVLGAGTSALAVAITGCTSEDSESDPDIATQDDGECDAMHRSEVAAERATPPRDVREAVVPIQYEELPDEEKDVAAKAIRGDVYAECSPLSDPFESLLDRIREHRDEQQRGSEADLTTVYLVRTRTYYALDAMVLDEKISW